MSQIGNEYKNNNTLPENINKCYLCYSINWIPKVAKYKKNIMSPNKNKEIENQSSKSSQIMFCLPLENFCTIYSYLDGLKSDLGLSQCIKLKM